jgi:transposase
MALTVSVEVPPCDREVLTSRARPASIRAGLAQRARIVLLAGGGLGTSEIVRRTGASKPTVILWKKRYAAEGTGGLEDRPRPGKPRIADDVAIVLATLEPPPARLGVTHRSSRLLAAELGVSNFKVATVWREWGLQPWRTESFRFSTDPALEAKVRDVTGLYLNPPDKAVVLCVDEKPQAQALERAAPVLPLRPGDPGKAQPRLHPARHPHAVRRAGGRDRQGDRRLLPSPPARGVSGVPAPGCLGLPTPQAAHRLR